MRFIPAVLSLFILLIVACCTPQGSLPVSLNEDTIPGNPLLEPFNNPFGVPPFDQIQAEHFIPAYEEKLRWHEAEIKAIVKNPASPTFGNTIAALDYSWQPLDRISYVFYNYYALLYDEELETIASIIDPLLTEHEDNVTLNQELFERVETVYLQRDELNLDEEDNMLLEKTFRSFSENGAALAQEEQQVLRDINQELATLMLQFANNIYADLDDFELYVEDAVLLSGLPETVIAAAAEEAKDMDREGEWLFTLYSSNILALMTHAEDRELRRAANEAYISRGGIFSENNNAEIVNRIIELRLELASLLGHDHYAAYALQNNMAGDAETVSAFLEEMWEAVLPVVAAEEEMIKAIIAEEGADFEPAYWDWRYYAEKIRRDKFEVDEEEVRQYLELNGVLDGLFAVIEKLWGLSFSERDDLPLYHPETSAWEAAEADGSPLGIVYLDLHPRSGKQSGASMNYFQPPYIDQDGKAVYPVIRIACNFSAPAEGEPVLLNFEDVNTLYHEFGHALHALFSTARYPLLSGTATPRDFVELPSQIMENWSRHPDVLKSFARHHESGEVISDELIERIQAASRFNQGFATLEILASAQLDYEYHTIDEYRPISITEFEQEIADRFGMPDSIYFRHGSKHFQHIFNWGYSSAYYSYLWAGVLDADAFEAFVETGDIFDQDTAARFRREILEKGATREPLDMYLAFRGREPQVEHLLKQRGLQ